MAVKLRYNLRMLRAPVKGTAYLFGDNQSMVTSSSLPHSMLKKHQSTNNYHQIREAVAVGVTSAIYCSTKCNLADMSITTLNWM
eukprot:4934981-Ditylum_brightwellii.AAC.1